MKIYLKILATLYLYGSILHLSDILGIRLNFSTMNNYWKAWTIFLLIADSIAFFGLWKEKFYGEATFLTVAFSQLISYVFFTPIFGNQITLIAFHLITVSIYIFFKIRVIRQKNLTT